MMNLSDIHFKDKEASEYCKSLISKKPQSDIQTFWLGRQDYNSIFTLQKEIHQNIFKGKSGDVLLMLEHDHVYTLGKNANENHILPLQDKCTDIAQVDRGGDVTYHGPGQLVCYPIINLNNYNKSISWYVTLIQECIIDVLAEHSINANKKESPFVGIWVDDEKIAAIGIRLSRWISMHGFAINVNTDLSYFDGIIPCGIFDYGVTSMEKVTNNKFDIEILAKKIASLFIERLKGVSVC